MKNSAYDKNINEKYSIKDCIKELKIIHDDLVDYFLQFMEILSEDQKRQNIMVKKFNKNKIFMDRRDGVLYFNDFFQSLGLKNLYSIGPIGIGPKTLKSNYQDRCGCLSMIREFFPYMFNEKICEKAMEVDEIRLMGTNHLFTTISLLFLKHKILNNSIKLCEHCNLLLLCGDHINNYFGEDTLSELECAKTLVELIFNGSKNVKIKNNGRNINMKVISAPIKKRNGLNIENGLLWSKTRTIDTINEANDLGLKSKNVIYLATQPFLTRYSYNHIYYGFDKPTCIGVDIDNFFSLLLYSSKEIGVTEEILHNYKLSDKLDFCDDIKEEYKALKNMPEYKELGTFSDDVFLRLAPAYILSEVARFINIKTLLYMQDVVIK